uniref:Uncharacterized protein n=1 Tax=Rhizophora mucronata TaxID=61149 RepID=A0A2P2Q4F9_RHIMU
MLVVSLCTHFNYILLFVKFLLYTIFV